MSKKYEFGTQPWEHQREALRRAWKRPGFAFLMEMGTGKSKVACDEAGIYHETDLIDAWIVMAPKGVYRNWTREGGEIRTHLPKRILDKASVAVWEAGGGNKTNQQALTAALQPGEGLRILVMNTEAVSSPGKARAYLEKFLHAHRCMWHLDESTFIKNHQAKRTKYLLDISPLAVYRRIMTGSPITNSPMDIWAQCEFLGPAFLGHRSFYGFRGRYADTYQTDFGGKVRRPVTLIKGYRNLDELSKRLAGVSYRVRKDECLDLPPKLYTTRDVELTDEQWRVYNSLRDESLAMIGETFVSTQLAITMLTALSRVACGHVRDDNGEEYDLPTRRPDVLMEVLEETDGKVIIWSRYRRDIDIITRRIRKDYDDQRVVAEYHGGNVTARQGEVQRFLEDPECRFMVSNQQTGGYGNTWNVATTTIYYSNSWSLEHRLQSEDRNHRGGQTEHVTYVDLVARGTVEERQVEALVAKLDVASMITGDGAREWITLNS